MQDSKEIWGYLGLVITFLAYIPYVIQIIRNKAKPHVFSWFIWGFLTGTVAVAQYTSNAGAGAWGTGLIAVLTLMIATFSLFKGSLDITRTDWIMFGAALTAIPLWLITSNPVYSVLLICLIDFLGFMPTFRKSFHKPYEEPATTYFLCGVAFGISLLAMDEFSLTTSLYPVMLFVMNCGLAGFMLWRRRITPPQTQN